MRKSFYLGAVSLGILCALMLHGCSGEHEPEREQVTAEDEQAVEQESQEERKGKKPEAEQEDNSQETEKENNSQETIENSSEDKQADPQMIEVDWSEYFDGLTGAAVFYNPSAGQFSIYNNELAQTRRSPCSTFKIISSLIALEHGIIDPDNSMRKWSGEVFWNEKWNKDIAFGEAFRESCVWYYREVIDEIGQELMQEELDRLSYGNCDISDWEGRLNTNNNNRALTGFWIESSLAISPKEQTEVMERIFGESSAYTEETRNRLKDVMLVEGQEKPGLSIYGKTGMGKAQGILVDAWFTGFAGRPEGNIYFCVYLGQTDDKEVSSATAKEIAIRLISDY